METFALFAEEVLRRHFEIFELQLIGEVVHHHPATLYFQAIADVPQVYDKRGEAVGALLDFFERGGAGKEDHEVRVLHAGDVDLAPVHDIPVFSTLGEGRELGSVGSGLGLGNAKSLKPELAARYLRQVLPFLLFGAVPKKRAHHVHLGVGRVGVGTGTVSFFEDGAGGSQVQAHPAVLLGDERCEVSGLGHRLDELLRVLAPGVEVAPVLIGELLTDFPHSLTEYLQATVFYDRGHSASLRFGRDISGACPCL